MKSLRIILGVVACNLLSLFVSAEETELHQIYGLCFIFEDQGLKAEQKACRECLNGIFEGEEVPPNDKLQSCLDKFPERVSSACGSADDTKQCCLQELKNYRQYAMEVMKKYHQKVFNLKEKNQFHQLWVSMLILHQMKQDLSDADIEIMVEPAKKSCFEPGAAPTDAESTFFTGDDLEDMVDKDEDNADMNSERVKRSANGGPQPSKEERRIVKNSLSRALNYYACCINKIAEDGDASGIVKNYLRGYQGVVPNYIVRKFKLGC